MAQDTTPAIIVYQGDGSNSVFSIPFDKGYYGEVKVLFVRRGLADYTYYPDTYVVNGRLYAWTHGTTRVFTHTPRPAVGAVIYTDEDIAPVTAITVTDLSDNSTVYTRSAEDDILIRGLYAWKNSGVILYTNTRTPTLSSLLYDDHWQQQTQLSITELSHITVSAIDGQTVTVDGVVYARAVQHDISNNLLLTWTGETLQLGDFICIIRDTERGQPYELPNNQKHIERALDNLERQIQEVKDATDNALKIDPSYDIPDSHKLDPIAWLATIVRSVDTSVRALRYANGWLDYSLDDPNIAEGEKTWTHAISTSNIKSFRYEVRPDEESGESLYYLYYTDANDAEHLVNLPISLVEKAIENAEEALAATVELDRRLTIAEEEIAEIIAGGNIDNITIQPNEDNKWEVQAVRNQNTEEDATNPIYDWVGTQEEYVTQDVANLHPDWLCFITDDMVPTGGTYVFEQGEAATTWYITHNLNKYPSVTVVDSAGTTIDCTVIYINSSECELRFNAAFKGTAYLN